MHLSVMRLAKKRGMEVYDLVSWGSEGVAQFKAGFCTRECCWKNPRTKVFRPDLGKFLSWGENRLHPAIWQFVRWRDNRTNNLANAKTSLGN